LDLPVAEIKNWVEEFVEMEKELNDPDEFSKDAIFYSISTFLVRASRMMRKHYRVVPSQGQDMLFTFHELIEKNFVELKTPREYAPLLHVTPNHLNAYCKRKSGMTAGQLIRQRILLEAKRLLAHTKLSVSEISFKLGFVDNSYFGRYFKKYCGTTPEGFRNRS
ncbi:MAG: helix-turn-helix domain-containing protein, partial [Saprospiraceae bacterium]